jgi:hypothetical protein
VAKGSEQFAWKQFPGVPHICDFCKRELRVKNVGEIRTYWEGDKPRIIFWCVDHRGGHE